VRPAVFLDRDGTMIHDVGYLRRLDDIRWFPPTIDAIRLLNRAGFLVCVVTNQSGIGRGLIAPEFVPAAHRTMGAALEAGGARVDGWFYCPHHPHAEVTQYRAVCECRKPAPGLIHQACAQFPIDLARSFVIGDKPIDVGLGVAVGARGILVRTGYGEEAVEAHGGTVPGAAFVAADLMEATSWLLGASGHPRQDGQECI
jgi:D-glycero-D-manno-heptose 1,7-bisphosphate phosphatase